MFRDREGGDGNTEGENQGLLWSWKWQGSEVARILQAMDRSMHRMDECVSLVARVVSCGPWFSLGWLGLNPGVTKRLSEVLAILHFVLVEPLGSLRLSDADDAEAEIGGTEPLSDRQSSEALDPTTSRFPQIV
ncbi:lon protease1, mitochondrial [Dorcoceras hygrometricum]|uniref:Lon protease1, mitochondrial n=1 Tax=Dorcoceras hygrometricum TaxID=472368 RepID=A0A2Z7CQL7_9LAMI|nr:lon protease1, mitochondrial [Dorcoceras hygrometricum]